MKSLLFSPNKPKQNYLTKCAFLIPFIVACLLGAQCVYSVDEIKPRFDAFVCFPIPEGKETQFHPLGDPNPLNGRELCQSGLLDYDGDGLPNMYDGVNGSLAGDYTQFAVENEDGVYEISNLYQLQAIMSLQCPPKFPASIPNEGGFIPLDLIPPLTPGVPLKNRDGMEIPMTDCADSMGDKNMRLNASYRLTADIDASLTADMSYDGDFDAASEPAEEGLLPLGNDTAPFQGSFDGREHRIYNLRVNRAASNDVGLFGVVSADAQINNINIEDSTVIGRDNVGLLMGRNLGMNEARVLTGNRASENSSARGAAGSMNVAHLIGNPIHPLSRYIATPVALTINENANITASYTEGPPVEWRLEGDDAAQFEMRSGGAACSPCMTASIDLRFPSPPDFENPRDNDMDNVYEVTLVNINGGVSTSRNITVTVQDIPWYQCTNGTANNSGGETSGNRAERCSSCTNGFFFTSGAICVTPPMASNAKVVIWKAGDFQGDFGFSRCQTLLDSTGLTIDGGRIGEALKAAGYTKAVFFGSTPDYNFIEIDTDEQALGQQTGGTPFTGSATDLRLRVAYWNSGAISYKDDFGGAVYSLGNLVNVAAGGRWWNNVGTSVIGDGALIGTGTFWSFTNNQIYSTPTGNCMGGASQDGMFTGVRGSTAATDTQIGTGSTIEICSDSRILLCVARKP